MEDEGKLFVGGLSWDTTEEKLKAYFSNHGEVATCTIMKDQVTNKSRGFGFVTFRDPKNVQSVLDATTPHTLDGRTIDPKPAVPRGSQPPANPGRAPGSAGGPPRPRPGEPRQWNGPPGHGMIPPAPPRGPYTGPTKKIFIGGLSPTTTEDEVKNFFSTHGTVTEVILKYDQSNNRMRGFGFVTFDSEGTVDHLVERRYVTLNSKNVEIKKAEPRNAPSQGPPYVPGRHQYWGDAQGYYTYPRHGGYGPPPPGPSQGAYYHPSGYASAQPSQYTPPNYPVYTTTGGYGNHYSAGPSPTYGSAGYSGAYSTGGYGGASASAYDSGYNASSAPTSHRQNHQYDGSYGASSSAAPYADNHSPVAPSAYPATASSSTYGTAVSVTTAAASAEAHAYPSNVYSNDYRSPAQGASYGQPSSAGPGSVQPGQRASTNLDGTDQSSFSSSSVDVGAELAALESNQLG